MIMDLTIGTDKKMVSTLELRDFEQAHPQKQQQHQHNNRWNSVKIYIFRTLKKRIYKNNMIFN